MKDFWDERYSKKEFAYGENPNEYLKAKFSGIPVGKVLFPAEGEGRNAVFSATLGWDVFAFDQSEEGKKKAKILAHKNGVPINYIVSDMEHVNYPQNSFDALVLIYAHFSSEKRKEYHQKLGSLLKKGGLLILEGFDKKHAEQQKQNPKAGGPKNVSMLYDLEELKSDFKEFDFTEAYECTISLDEGLYHVGQAAVVRILAIKK
ncbi:class I SAM-dependent methyltransferase [Sphingobacterium corticibacterium]|uniref:Class I SAM-dependent methyltransferase n=1 Tax=Sphingobacterium corticibacterium TaxID=2484746 RepID=A0A4Q6XN05_9SPHI|nr:class I SAM-dependent methyltransferase [Sphingobacterium corticibacterium]RZF57919.1 class I SAM-dependent methyltransferase [Sphingobacterium corticibacterium]